MAKSLMDFPLNKKVKHIDFFLDSDIIAIDEKDLIHIDGMIFYSDRSAEECVVQIHKLDFLFLQSQFFDRIKKFYLQNKAFVPGIGLIEATEYEYIGVAKMVDEEAMAKEFDMEDEGLLNADQIEFIYKDSPVVRVKKCELKSDNGK